MEMIMRLSITTPDHPKKISNSFSNFGLLRLRTSLLRSHWRPTEVRAVCGAPDEAGEALQLSMLQSSLLLQELRSLGLPEVPAEW